MKPRRPRNSPLARWRQKLSQRAAHWRYGRAAMHFWCWAIRCGNRRFHWEGIQRELRSNRPKHFDKHPKL